MEHKKFNPGYRGKMKGANMGEEQTNFIDMNIAMDVEAMKIAGNYAWEHLDRSDPVTSFEIFVVWKAKILQNWKFLISTSLYDGMYYELTYNGDKHEWYLDAYKKFENRRITDEQD